MADDNVESLTVTKLVILADYYASIVPSVARHYMAEAENMKSSVGLPETRSTQVCQYCSTLWRPGNVSISTRNTTGRNVRGMSRILKKRNKGTVLNKTEEKILEKFQSRHKLRLLCKTCNKTTLLPFQKQIKPLKLKCETENLLETDSDTDHQIKKSKKSKKKARRRERDKVIIGNTDTPILSSNKPIQNMAPHSTISSTSSTPASSTRRTRDREGVTPSKSSIKKEKKKLKHNILQNIIDKETSKSPQNTSKLHLFLSSLK